MAQHRRATSIGQDSMVHLHLKDKDHSFEDAYQNAIAKNTQKNRLAPSLNLLPKKENFTLILHF